MMFRKGAMRQLKLSRMKRSLAKLARSFFVLILVVVVALILKYLMIPHADGPPEIAAIDEPGKKVFVNPANDSGIIKAMEAGQYKTGLEKLAEALKAQPENLALKSIQNLLMDSLSVSLQFHYLPERKSIVSTRGETQIPILTSQDPYYLTLHLSDKSYFYIFQLDENINFHRLFPNTEIVPTQNPVPPGPLRIPDGPEWFYLDNILGLETIYLVASRWRQWRLEKLADNIINEKDDSRKVALIQKISEELKIIDNVTNKIPGLAFAKYQFQHVASLTKYSY